MADEKVVVAKLEDLLMEKKRADEGERIEKVAIIGAGVMGQGIAQTISAAGLDVLIVEKNEIGIQKAQEGLKAGMEREIARWAMTKSEMKSILSKMTWSLNMEDIKDYDLVIEAVEENLESKQCLCKSFDELAKADAIFVSNTSTLSLSKIADVCSRKDKVIGMHFLNPVPKVPLVELIRTIETSEHTINTVKEFADKIGKTAVEVYEYPGYVTTRAIVPLLNEAMHILLEGLATAKDIDTAMKLGYKFQAGPLEMADNMGLDEVLTWMEQLWSTLGEPRYRPCPILRKLVREKKLGKKTGEGFYKYDVDGKIIS